MLQIPHAIGVRLGLQLKSYPYLPSSPSSSCFLPSLTRFSREFFPDKSVTLKPLPQGLILGRTGLGHFSFMHKAVREVWTVQVPDGSEPHAQTKKTWFNVRD